MYPNLIPSTDVVAGSDGPHPTLQIESLETRAHDFLKFLHSFRGMLGPVNRLPQEVISHIAWCCWDGDTIDGRPIIPLTHVCRYWRESVISTPKHWTVISSHSKNLMVLGLERSKVAPLQLQLEIGHVKKNSEFHDLIAPYVQNVESLQFKDVYRSRTSHKHS